ncbi:MAG: aldo/keto reductase, partial [bacterium]|nr:aldo/keto reductase [bacterium]
MIYKRLGRTGYDISRLGFGAMRLPNGLDGMPDPEQGVRVIQRAFDLGVNYIDTAVMYCGGKSQTIIGQALKGWRDKIVVSTKNHYMGPDESVWWGNLEDSLRLL